MSDARSTPSRRHLRGMLMSALVRNRPLAARITRFLALLLAVTPLALPAAWTFSVVDRNGDVGHDSSIQVNGGNPVVAYWDGTNTDLRLATCTSGCTGATPTWVVTTIDSAGDVGSYASLQINGG